MERHCTRRQALAGIALSATGMGFAAEANATPGDRDERFIRETEKKIPFMQHRREILQNLLRASGPRLKELYEYRETCRKELDKAFHDKNTRGQAILMLHKELNVEENGIGGSMAEVVQKAGAEKGSKTAKLAEYREQQRSLFRELLDLEWVENEIADIEQEVEDAKRELSEMEYTKVELNLRKSLLRNKK